MLYLSNKRKEILNNNLAILPSHDTTSLFIDTAFAKEREFKMEKLRNPLLVRNVDEIVNMGEAITHQVECNMFFKGHVERVRIDAYNLGKIEVILGIPWLVAHNPEID